MQRSSDGSKVRVAVLTLPTCTVPDLEAEATTATQHVGEIEGGSVGSVIFYLVRVIRRASESRPPCSTLHCRNASLSGRRSSLPRQKALPAFHGHRACSGHHYTKKRVTLDVRCQLNSWYDAQHRTHGGTEIKSTYGRLLNQGPRHLPFRLIWGNYRLSTELTLSHVCPEGSR